MIWEQRLLDEKGIQEDLAFGWVRGMVGRYSQPWPHTHLCCYSDSEVWVSFKIKTRMRMICISDFICCYKKLQQMCWPNQHKFIFYSSGQASKIKVWAALNSFWKLPEIICFLAFSSCSRLSTLLGSQPVSHITPTFCCCPHVFYDWLWPSCLPLIRTRILFCAYSSNSG